MDRAALIGAIEERIGDRTLVWFGTRGSDAAPLRASIEQFGGVFSIIAPLGVASWVPKQEACLEQLTGQRVDLNAYHVDHDRSEQASELHRLMMDALAEGSVVAAYRSCHFVSAACHVLGDRSDLLSMFHGVQAAFDYKPWVETALAKHGVRTITWRYYSHHHWQMINERRLDIAHVVRSSYTDGGLGVGRLPPRKPLVNAPSWSSDRLIALSEELVPNVPLNVGACIFGDGTVTVHAPSLQLIGIPSCTTIPFGYCGNDFAVVASALSSTQLSALEEMTTKVGEWMWIHGYRGAFGIDVLLHKDELYLAEVNARFQGSSAVSAEIAHELGVCDIYLDHLAALLDVSPPGARPSLAEQAGMQAAAKIKAQVVAYSENSSLRSTAPVPDVTWGRIVGVPLSDTIVVSPNGMLFKLLVNRSVTETGFDIAAELATEVLGFRDRLYHQG